MMSHFETPQTEPVIHLQFILIVKFRPFQTICARVTQQRVTFSLCLDESNILFGGQKSHLHNMARVAFLPSKKAYEIWFAIVIPIWLLQWEFEMLQGRMDVGA